MASDHAFLHSMAERTTTAAWRWKRVETAKNVATTGASWPAWTRLRYSTNSSDRSGSGESSNGEIGSEKGRLREPEVPESCRNHRDRTSSRRCLHFSRPTGEAGLEKNSGWGHFNGNNGQVVRLQEKPASISVLFLQANEVSTNLVKRCFHSIQPL